jgi:hypothetical protein
MIGTDALCASAYFDMESDINALKIWARALQHAVMEENIGDDEEERHYRNELAVLLANLVRDKTAELYDKYHA